MILYQWAARHGVTMEAIAELQTLLGCGGTPGDADYLDKSEAFADSQIVLEAAQKGIRLWRNNVGALQDDTGRVVRYGLANESSAVNEKIKSSDRIGIRPVLITQEHVGLVIGQFVGREAKQPGWTYTGRGREPAQLAFALLCCAMGADVAFATGKGSL